MSKVFDIATERTNIRKAQQGDLEARRELHKTYKGLVDGIVYNTYSGSKQPVLAVRMEAERLLDKYIDSCNPDAATQPSTYLRTAITKKLHRYVNDNQMIRPPENVNTQLKRFTESKSELSKSMNREPSDIDIMHHMNKHNPTFNFTLKDVGRFRDSLRGVTFGSNTINSGGEDGGTSVGDLYFTSPDVDPINDLVTDLKLKELKGFIDTMPDPKRSILMHHEGLFGYPKLSQRQIATKFGMSKYNVEKHIKEGKDDIHNWLS